MKHSPKGNLLEYNKQVGPGLEDIVVQTFATSITTSVHSRVL